MRYVFLSLSLLVLSLAPAATGGVRDILWSDRPASDWSHERYPLGNGALGVMPDGGVATARYQFNVDSLWTGDANLDANVDDAGADRNFSRMGEYRNFGELAVAFDGATNGIPAGYRRVLDLGRAIHEVTGGGVRRTCFVSAPDGVFALEVRSDAPLSGTVSLSGANGEKTSAEGVSLRFEGAFANGRRHAAEVRVLVPGGRVTVVGGTLRFTGGRSILVLLAADTDFDLKAPGFRNLSRLAGVGARLDAAAGKGFDSMLRAHEAEYAPWFRRVSLAIGPADEAAETLSTAARVARCQKGARDPGLERLMFQFGRYLLISSSRPGTLPANLQGIWNDSNKPAWHCDYHSNINIQMNYWGAEPANLSETHLALLDWMAAIRPVVAAETRLAFPSSQGVAYRTSLNAFGGMGWRWNWPGAAWMAHHAWEHYDFTRDEAFLRATGYPLLKDAAEFCLGCLKERPDGKLVVPNGWSPEHGPREDGVTHDQQVVAQLFADVLAAQRVLKDDDAFAAKVAAAAPRLLGNKIGSWGQLQEWAVDRDQKGDQHRHSSHLFAVYPGDGITARKTPELMKAAEVSLNRRALTGDARRSWTWPWRLALRARFHDGAAAGRMFQGLLAYNTCPNLFTIHPPFQMDGNFGIVAAVCETLVQSHDGCIELLPAPLPGWMTGQMDGLRARGDVTVGFDWKDGKVTVARLVSGHGGTFIVRMNGEDRTVTLAPGKQALLQLP